MTPPIWRDDDGNPRPTRSCPRCGAVQPISRHQATTLRMLGWAPWSVVSWVEWCGHRVEVILAPEPDGWCSEIPVLGEAP